MAKRNSAGKIILTTVVILFFVLIIAVGSLVGLLYGKYQINLFSCIDQINKFNETVKVENLVTNGYTEEDLAAIEADIKKAENGEAQILSFTDRELCAYLNENLNYLSGLKFGDMDLDLSACGLEVLQIKLSEIPLNQPDKHYCNLNAVVRLNLSTIKNEKMTGFPANILKNILHDELYLSVDCSVDEVGSGYRVTPTGITINNLSSDNTKSFLTTISKLTSFPTADELNKSVATAIVDALLSDEGIYGKLKDATGYGWQAENEFVVYFVDVNQIYNINYDTDEHHVDNPNLTEYTVRNNRIYLQDLSDNGYDFLGWFMDIDGEKTKVTTIESSTRQEYNLYCKWQLITYTITYDLRKGTIDGEYKKTYTIEDETFTLPTNAKRKVSESQTLEFLGWLGEDLTKITKVVTIEHGSYGNKHYAAYYVGEESSLTLMVDGVTVVNAAKIETGTVLSREDLNNLVKDKLAGYSIANWYLPDNSVYNYAAPLDENKTLHATTTYLTDRIYFYPYLTEFKNAVANSSILKITSHEMLVGYIDYCVFYDVTNQDVKLDLTYTHNVSGEISNAVNELYEDEDKRIYRKTSPKMGYEGNSFHLYGKFYFEETSAEQYAKNSFTENVYKQQDYALRVDDLGVRPDDFENFEINYVGKQIPVSDSSQLVWVLENGYQPVCEPGSRAETIYNDAKQVVRDVCTDDMNDVQKLQAIYQWLALNVSYDQEAYKQLTEHLITNEEALTYKSWYPEGVFSDKRAVCEGYAKSLLIMAKLEGIPAICVSGDGHMWNKVYLDGVWYGIDATHADLEVVDADPAKSQEVFTNTAFLFTDAYKTSKGYTATNYTEFVADTKINSYDYLDFTYNGNQYDLLIDSQVELNALFAYIGSYTPAIACERYTVEVAVASGNRANFESWLGWTAWQKRDLTGWPINDSYGNWVYILYRDV